VLEENLAMLDSFYKTKEDTAAGGCKENECSLYAHVIKSRQIMHLYINGEMKDSFEISTGLEKYATPEMSIRPRGPVFKKYTSKKFPGGNYKGLGNMPYVVFIKGGYAIHGTTQGNLKKLGQTASHGCIRLHPDNARLFYELVKVFGLKKTWVKVEE
jgi:lipoprotein-anchoring transpeptidase ErfK/SrfK